MYQISGTNGRYIYRINIPEKEAAMDKPSELFSADEDEDDDDEGRRRRVRESRREVSDKSL